MLRDVAELHDDDGHTPGKLGMTNQGRAQCGVILVTMSLAEADHVGFLPRGENSFHDAAQIGPGLSHRGLRAAPLNGSEYEEQRDPEEKPFPRGSHLTLRHARRTWYESLVQHRVAPKRCGVLSIRGLSA